MNTFAYNYTCHSNVYQFIGTDEGMAKLQNKLNLRAIKVVCTYKHIHTILIITLFGKKSSDPYYAYHDNLLF